MSPRRDPDPFGASPDRDSQAGLLLAYFAERREARRAIRKLRSKGFRRAALVHKTAAGDIQTQDPFRWRRVFGTILAAILFGGLAGLAFLLLDRPLPLLNRGLSLAVSMLAGGLLGVLCGGLWLRRSRIGIERKLLENQRRWLISGETVLILQSPMETMPFPVALLQESGEISPAVFVLHPRRGNPMNEVRSSVVTLSPAQIREQGQRLARDQQVDPRPRRKAELLRRLEKARRLIHQAVSDLSGAGRLEQGLPPTAEWLLDNEYVIESQARDVQLNLPRRYYQQLPFLANEPYRGLPRIYSLAKALVSHTELRLDRENILAFGEAYQSVQTTDDRRTLGDPSDAAHRPDRGHPASGRRGADRTAGTGGGRLLGQPAHDGQPAQSHPTLFDPGRTGRNPARSEPLFRGPTGR